MVIPLIFPKVPQSSLGSPVTPLPLKNPYKVGGVNSVRSVADLFKGGTLGFGGMQSGNKVTSFK